MALEPEELQLLMEIRADGAETKILCERVDERTQGMQKLCDDRHETTQTQIKAVRQEARNAGGKLGGASGGAVSIGLMAIWEAIKAQFSAP